MTSFFKGLWLVASRMAYLRKVRIVKALWLLSGGSPNYETGSSEASFLEAQSSYNTGSEYEATATRPSEEIRAISLRQRRPWRSTTLNGAVAGQVAGTNRGSPGMERKNHRGLATCANYQALKLGLGIQGSR
jgi:hypothetical protein